MVGLLGVIRSQTGVRSLHLCYSTRFTRPYSSSRSLLLSANTRSTPGSAGLRNPSNGRISILRVLTNWCTRSKDTFPSRVQWIGNYFWLKHQEDPDPAKAGQYKRWRELRKLQEVNASARSN